MVKFAVKHLQLWHFTKITFFILLWRTRLLKPSIYFSAALRAPRTRRPRHLTTTMFTGSRTRKKKGHRSELYPEDRDRLRRYFVFPNFGDAQQWMTFGTWFPGCQARIRFAGAYAGGWPKRRRAVLRLHPAIASRVINSFDAKRSNDDMRRLGK